MSTRKQRAFTQPIYLLKMNPIIHEYQRTFKVIGSTGKLYTVDIKKHLSCTCPDHQQNKTICKHIYFILLRVMKINCQIKHIYTDNELIFMFNNIPEHISQEIIIKKPTKINQKFDDVCPICLDDINSNSDNIDYCKYGCGKSVHINCFQIWNNTSGINKCAFCRIDWTNQLSTDELISKFRITELQNICQENNLPSYGSKITLFNRLVNNNIIPTDFIRDV